MALPVVSLPGNWLGGLSDVCSGKDFHAKEKHCTSECQTADVSIPVLRSVLEVHLMEEPNHSGPVDGGEGTSWEQSQEF